MESKKKKAIFFAKKGMAGLVYNFTQLEGMNFTLPEVQTYLQGITVGGHKITDEKKLGQQILAWSHLLELVEKGGFNFSKETACALQGIVAKEEALEWGVFRSGGVRISGTDYIPPVSEKLDDNFQALCSRLTTIENIKERGFIASLDMARNQYFYDGNKRTGLLMMNGIFISHGVMPFSIPAKDVLQYNENMLRFYSSGDEREMLDFYKRSYQKEYSFMER